MTLEAGRLHRVLRVDFERDELELGNLVSQGYSYTHTVCQGFDELPIGCHVWTSQRILGLLDNGKRGASYGTTGSTCGNLVELLSYLRRR